MPGLRRALLALFALGVLFAGADVALVLTSDHETQKALAAVLIPLIGLSFIGTGTFAWWRRPLNRFGLLMTAVGFAWFIGQLTESNNAVVFTVATFVGPLYLVLVVQLVLSFPTGRLDRVSRAIVAGAYFTAYVLTLPVFLLDGDLTPPKGAPDNAFAIAHEPGIANVIDLVTSLLGFALTAATAYVLVRRRRDSTPAQRRAQAPTLRTGLVVIVFVGLVFAGNTVGVPDDVIGLIGFIGFVAFVILPFAFLAGLFGTRNPRAGAVGELVERLNAPDTRTGLRAALAGALGDPTLELVYWRPSAGHYVTREGHRVELPAPDAGRAVAEVERDGKRVGAIIHDAALDEDPSLVRTAAAAAALQLENEPLHPGLRAPVEELQSSRARLVEVTMGERRRLERDLHDGAQQRLVALSIQLAMARRKLADDPETSGRLLDAARTELEQALGELRELARGIHPAILTDRGLGAALEALAERAPVAVDLHQMPEDRLPAAVEAAAYFVVAESLTNVARYASAEHASVRVGRENGYAVVEVRDDGVGGADPTAGSGLRGMADRLAPPPRGPRLAGGGRPPCPPRRPTRGPLATRRRHRDPRQHPLRRMRVVLADDSMLLREGVARLLEDAGLEVVAQAGDAEDLLRKVGAHKPDVAIVDVRMPPTHTDEGLRAAAEIQERHPGVGVLVLSQYIEEGYAMELLSSNAEGVGYLLKDRVADLERFVDAVRRVGEGGSALDPEVVSRLLGRRRREDPLSELSPREKEVLGLMAEGRSNNAIASQLVVTERAVEKHVTSIFNKLNLPPVKEDHRRVLAVETYLRGTG